MSDLIENDRRRASFVLFVVGLCVLGSALAYLYSRVAQRHFSIPADAAVRIDVNTASATDLKLLPGIHTSTAQKIVAERERRGPFQDAVDLMERVEGVGPVLIRSIQSHAVFSR